MQSTRQTLHGKKIAADLSNAELISSQHIPDCFGRPIELLGHRFDRPLREFLAQDLQLGLGPTAMVYAPLDSVWKDETPSLFSHHADASPAKPAPETRTHEFCLPAAYPFPFCCVEEFICHLLNLRRRHCRAIQASISSSVASRRLRRMYGAGGRNGSTVRRFRRLQARCWSSGCGRGPRVHAAHAGGCLRISRSAPRFSASRLGFG